MSGQTREIFELMDGQKKRAVIRVIGVGGGGCNTVNQMAQANIEGVEFISANTDRDHLERCVPTSCRSARRSRAVSVRAPTRASAARPPRKIAIASVT